METLYHYVRLVVPAPWSTHAENLLSDVETTGWISEGSDPVTLTAYVSSQAAAVNTAARLRASLERQGLPAAEFSCGPGATPAEDWETQWRTRLSPLRIGKTWLVRPSWQDSDPFSGRTTLIVDPKMAFGTGTHPTTQLCLLELEELDLTGSRVLDVGSGTGILAMAAAKLGASDVTAVEIDVDAVACAAENLSLNGLEGKIQLVTGKLEDAPDREVDVILANIQFEPLTALGGDLRERLARAGTAIFSGILQSEAEAFVDVLTRAGWSVRRIRRGYDPTTDDAWMSFTAKAD